jgi:hypothetical protein
MAEPGYGEPGRRVRASPFLFGPLAVPAYASVRLLVREVVFPRQAAR